MASKSGRIMLSAIGVVELARHWRVASCHMLREWQTSGTVGLVLIWQYWQMTAVSEKFGPFGGASQPNPRGGDMDDALKDNMETGYTAPDPKLLHDAGTFNGTVTKCVSELGNVHIEIPEQNSCFTVSTKRHSDLQRAEVGEKVSVTFKENGAISQVVLSIAKATARAISGQRVKYDDGLDILKIPAYATVSR